jgi:hypothetical protein
VTIYPDTLTDPAARTTTAGAPYEQVTVTPQGAGDPAVLLVPPTAPRGAGITLVLYTHGKDGTETQLNDPVLQTTRDSYLHRGWVVAAPYAHGNAWGNQAALDDCVRLYNYCAALWNVQNVLLYGASMGGLTTLLLYGLDLIPNVRGCVAVDPAAGLTWLGQNSAAHAASIRAAYGATGAADIPAKVTGHDPSALPAAAYSGKRMRLYASATDTSIPRANNTDPFAATFAPPVAKRLDVVTVTGEHFIADHFRPADVIRFYLDVLPRPAPTAVKVWVGSTWLTVTPKTWNGVAWVPAGVYAAAPA